MITFAHNGCQYVDSGYILYQSPQIIEDATPKMDQTLLTLYWRCVDALLTFCWRSFWGVAVLTDTILLMQASNTSIIGKCSSTSQGFYKLQHPKLLMLSWRSVDTLLTLCWCSDYAVFTLFWCSSFCVVTTTLTTLPIDPANTSIIDWSLSLALGFSQMHHPKLSTFCVCCIDILLTCLCWCQNIDIYLSDYNRAQYCDYR
jgi:hypothetical protein